MRNSKGINIVAHTLEELKDLHGPRIHVRPIFKVEMIIYMRNGCCKDLPVLLTTNPRRDGSTNYSTQCACGGWCSTGRETAAQAISDYERMSDGENLYGGILDFVL